MGALRSGLQIATAAAAASTVLAGSFLGVAAETNPWGSVMDKYNIPLVHGEYWWLEEWPFESVE